MDNAKPSNRKPRQPKKKEPENKYAPKPLVGEPTVGVDPNYVTKVGLGKLKVISAHGYTDVQSE
jgi:hypothetical protein